MKSLNVFESIPRSQVDKVLTRMAQCRRQRLKEVGWLKFLSVKAWPSWYSVTLIVWWKAVRISVMARMVDMPTYNVDLVDQHCRDISGWVVTQKSLFDCMYHSSKMTTTSLASGCVAYILEVETLSCRKCWFSSKASVTLWASRRQLPNKGFCKGQIWDVRGQ